MRDELIYFYIGTIARQTARYPENLPSPKHSREEEPIEFALSGGLRQQWPPTSTKYSREGRERDPLTECTSSEIFGESRCVLYRSQIASSIEVLREPDS